MIFVRLYSSCLFCNVRNVFSFWWFRDVHSQCHMLVVWRLAVVTNKKKIWKRILHHLWNMSSMNTLNFSANQSKEYRTTAALNDFTIQVSSSEILWLPSTSSFESWLFIGFQFKGTVANLPTALLCFRNIESFDRAAVFHLEEYGISSFSLCWENWNVWTESAE